jgi:ABC-type spermidine/putrescine transport system permease subunit I
MANGMAVYDASGSLIWDTAGILARVIGTGSISFSLNQYTTKTITISNLLSTDNIIVFTTDNQYCVYTVSSVGTSVSITRTRAYGGYPSTYLILAVRTQ